MIREMGASERRVGVIMVILFGLAWLDPLSCDPLASLSSWADRGRSVMTPHGMTYMMPCDVTRAPLASLSSLADRGVGGGGGGGSGASNAADSDGADDDLIANDEGAPDDRGGSLMLVAYVPKFVISGLLLSQVTTAREMVWDVIGCRVRSVVSRARPSRGSSSSSSSRSLARSHTARSLAGLLHGEAVRARAARRGRAFGGGAHRGSWVVGWIIETSHRPSVFTTSGVAVVTSLSGPGRHKRILPPPQNASSSCDNTHTNTSHLSRWASSRSSRRPAWPSA